MSVDTMSRGSARTEEYLPLPMRQPKVAVEQRQDGSMLIEQSYEMPEPWPSLVHLFADRSARFPDRWYIAKRAVETDGFGEWQGISYSEALRLARNVAQFLIDRGMGPDKGVMVLSGNSIRHAVLMLAAQIARAPIIPVSTGYSLQSTDFSKLRHTVALCDPGLLFAEEGAPFTSALAALGLKDRIVATADPIPTIPTIDWSEMVGTAASEAVDRSIAVITPETVAKIIFTSGSTGAPKGVLQTQRMLSGIIAQHDALYINEAWGEPKAYLSWMPWSHVGGGNINMCDVINDAATLYIDDGRPTPTQFGETIRNLREISPSEYQGTPLFFAHLIGALESDLGLRRTFFARLRYVGYGTAGLSQDLLDRFQALARAETGCKIPVISKYGSTETQGMTVTSWPLEEVGPIGLPFPGITVKLAPVGDKLEIRIKGDTVTPGYLNNPEANAKAFDEEGFYCTGDAGVMIDRADPAKGLMFDGRVTENFKMSTGTWVSVGALRLGLIRAFSPLVADAVIAGHDRDSLAALVWLHNSEVRRMFGIGATSDTATLIADPRVRAHLLEKLRDYNQTATGLSTRVSRLLILDEPPTGDEVAEKGYINQRATLTRRKADVTRLYAAPVDPDVLQA